MQRNLFSLTNLQKPAICKQLTQALRSLWSQHLIQLNLLNVPTN